MRAVSVPVTLKIRTGWSPEHRNGITIAKIAEASGVLALAVHGRTRACMFRGSAEHETVCAIKAAVKIPVVRERRYRFTAEGSRDFSIDWRRWRDDRARCTGSAMDFSRSQLFPRQRT